MRDLGTDGDVRSSPVARRAVPNRFLETPGRLWVKRMTRTMGLYSFIVTVLTIVSCFLGMLIPSLVNVEFFDALPGLIVLLIFVNHLGLLFEMGADSSGVNWFSKSAGLMWLSLFGTFLIAIVVEIVKSLF